MTRKRLDKGKPKRDAAIMAVTIIMMVVGVLFFSPNQISNLINWI